MFVKHVCLRPVQESAFYSSGYIYLILKMVRNEEGTKLLASHSQGTSIYRFPIITILFA